jgi:hypothetical protein
VNEAEGVGFVVAIASYEPFDYRRVSNRDRWDTWQLSSGRYRTTYGRNAYPDPYELVGSFIDRALPASAEYSTDYIQYQVVRDYLYQRRYSNYNDVYDRCLSIYYGRADYYCSQYATYGYPIYVPIIIGRYPAPQEPPDGNPTPNENRPKLRDRTIGDPVVVGGIENGANTAQRSPTSSEVARADAQRTWWNAQRRENSRHGAVLDRPQIDPNATTVPQVYRSSPSQPRVETEPSRRSEPRVETGYEPMRSEPMRSEPVHRAEPQPEHVPVMRSEPAPQGKYERPVQSAPVQSAPVIRSEIPRVEVRPSPPPPPPPSSPPTQVHSEPVQSRPVVPPPAPSVKDQ